MVPKIYRDLYALENAKQIHVHITHIVAAIIEQLQYMAKEYGEKRAKGAMKKSSCSKQFQNSTQKSSPCTRVFFMRISWKRGWLQGRIARAFSSNSLVNSMDMTAAIQYILTAAQSLGSQVYYKKSRMTILGLAGVLFCENEQAYA